MGAAGVVVDAAPNWKGELLAEEEGALVGAPNAKPPPPALPLPAAAGCELLLVLLPPNWKGAVVVGELVPPPAEKLKLIEGVDFMAGA